VTSAGQSCSRDAQLIEAGVGQLGDERMRPTQQISWGEGEPLRTRWIYSDVAKLDLSAMQRYLGQHLDAVWWSVERALVQVAIGEDHGRRPPKEAVTSRTLSSSTLSVGIGG